LTVRNPVRIPVVYSVELPARLSGVFAVTPSRGLLRGHQTATLTVSFRPVEQKEYRLRGLVHVRAVGGAAQRNLAGDGRLVGDVDGAVVVAAAPFTILASGSGAVVVFDPPALDFGTLLVNNSAEQEVAFHAVSASIFFST
jgi:hypothetical protein